jgi:hypothetical protein
MKSELSHGHPLFVQAAETGRYLWKLHTRSAMAANGGSATEET